MLLVVDHQEALRPRPDLLGHVADRRADLRLGRGALAPGALRLVGEDTGRAPAGARLRLGRRPRTAHSHEQAAVGALERFPRPVLTDLLLYEEVTVGAIPVGGRPALLALNRCHRPLVLHLSPKPGATKPLSR